MYMINIDAIKPDIKNLAEKHGLSLVVLFGSQATGALHPKSDVDIAVLSKGHIDMLALTGDFYKLLQREDVEVVNLGTASPTLMYVVVRDGKLLCENEVGAFLRWKLYAIWVWLDTAWLRRLRDQKMLEWARTA